MKVSTRYGFQACPSVLDPIALRLLNSLGACIQQLQDTCYKTGHHYLLMLKLHHVSGLPGEPCFSSVLFMCPKAIKASLCDLLLKQFLPYFFAYKTVFFSFQNNPKNLDPSYKMDLDLWDCLGRVKLILQQNCIGLI